MIGRPTLRQAANCIGVSGEVFLVDSTSGRLAIQAILTIQQTSMAALFRAAA